MATPDGLHRVSIPTPFEIGAVNCYLFEGDALTMLDPGPATDDAWATLTTQLADIGYDITDVDQLILSHPHIDHFGLANRVVMAADARVLAHENAVDPVQDPETHFDRERAFFRHFFPTMGVPDRIVDTIVEVLESYSALREPVRVDRTLTDGAEVAAQAPLRVLHTPGHARGAICLISSAMDAAFTGDHVMADISPNPLLSVLPQTNERTRSLPQYIRSLRRLRAVDVTTGYGGHREPIPDLHGRIDEILTHHSSRKDEIARVLAEDGPLTAYEVMQTVFPQLPDEEVFPGMTEIIGHLDLLEDEGRVEPIEAGTQIRYHAT